MMISSFITFVDRRDHVQYLTVSDNCAYSLTEQNTTFQKLYYGLIRYIFRMLCTSNS